MGDERGLISWLIRAALLPASLLYRAGLAVYLSVYASGLRKRHRLPVPVISVGNLTFGGTGKTPAVIELCRILRDQHRRVVVLSRGHGGKARGSLVVSDTERTLCTASEAGDEPVMLANALPGTPVLVDKDRRRSGELACSSFKPDVVVLDDGLQYWQLERDINVLVMDAERPFGSGFVMPMGDLREPASGLRRADVIFLGNADGLAKQDRERLDRRLSSMSGGSEVFVCRRSPVSVVEIGSDKIQPAVWLRGRRAVAFCGIGRPGLFFEGLEELGTQVMECLAFPDHHAYSEDDLSRIARSKAERRADLVVTTEKDAARLQESGAAATDLIGHIYVLRIELEIERRDRFAQYIADRLDRSHKATAS